MVGVVEGQPAEERAVAAPRTESIHASVRSTAHADEWSSAGIAEYSAPGAPVSLPTLSSGIPMNACADSSARSAAPCQPSRSCSQSAWSPETAWLHISRWSNPNGGAGNFGFGSIQIMSRPSRLSKTISTSGSSPCARR